MRTISNILDKTLALFTEGTVSIAAVVALLVALIGTMDVLTTRVFSQAIPGAFEMSEAGLVLMVFLGLAIVTREGSHIKVDILVSRMNQRLRQYFNIFALFLTAAFFGLMAKQMWPLAVKSWQITERATGLLPFPIYPVKTAALLGVVVATLEALRRLITAILGLLAAFEKDPE